MIELINGEITDGTHFADIDDIVHIEKETEETFLVTINDDGYNSTTQFYGDADEMQKAVTMQNDFVTKFNKGIK